MSVKQVFISYSGVYVAMGTRLYNDLRNAGVHAWFDKRSMEPGTPSYGQAIEGAIQSSQVFIYIASPEATKSHFVIHEWHWALRYHVDAIPFWIAGSNWLDAALYGMAETEYIDARTDYAGALNQLLTQLRQAQLCQDPVIQPRKTSPEIDVVDSRVSPTVGTDSSFVLIPEGVCEIGSDLEEVESLGAPGSYMHEYPAHTKKRHEVKVAAFEIGKYPVTVGEYKAFLEDLASTARYPDLHFVQPGRTIQVPDLPASWVLQLPASWERQRGTPTLPVTGISWFDALQYCRWLSKNTGRVYRLPTVAEWEKAARWGRNAYRARIYAWGDDWNPMHCNAGTGQIEPVGQRPTGASDYGVQDLIGNVWEWTIGSLTPYHSLTSRSIAEEVDRALTVVSADEIQGMREVRGSSYSDGGRVRSRAAVREAMHATAHPNDVGFRVVRVL